MIAYYTDNQISRNVIGVISSRGIRQDHIKNFSKNKGKPAIFYGMLRGCGTAIRWHTFERVPFIYVDNGYVDAMYVDRKMVKNMRGTYRIVKNALLDVFPHRPKRTEPYRPLRFMMMPPTVYSAFMHDTTPGDWINHWANILQGAGHEYFIRSKDSEADLAKDFEKADAVLAFNSIAAVSATSLGKAVYTTNGIFNNAFEIERTREIPYYDFMEVKNFYKTKQYSLSSILRGEADHVLRGKS